ncbi:MAG TPA: lipopolysaccharide biosynthesis protein [Gemmatimonadota bacterium]
MRRIVPDASSSDPDRHLRVDAVRADLRGRTVRSGFIQLANQGVLFVMTASSTMVLARILTPADYGLVAMVTALPMLTGTFRDLGLPMATAHRENLSHRDANALFWIGLRINTVIALALAALSPAVAWFYAEPRLVRLTLVMTAGMFVLGLGAQHASLLVRQMQFGRLAFIDVVATLAGVVTAIGATLLGAGFWALALQQVVFGAARSAGLWWACGWRPDWGGLRRVELTPEVRALLTYAGHYSGLRLLSQAATTVDRVLVGYFAGAASLGLYANAIRWAQAPVMQIFPPLARVAVAGLSRKQHDPAGYRSACRAGFLPVLAVVMPALAFLAVEARDVIRVLLGDRWLAAVPILRILCLAYFVGSLSRLTSLLMLSQGDTKRQLRWGLVSVPVTVIAVGIGVQWGPVGAAVGVATASLLLSSPRLVFSLEKSLLKPREFVLIAVRPAATSLAAAAVLLAAVLLFPDTGSPVIRLAVGLVIFGAAYAAAWAATPGGRRAAGEVLGLLRELGGKGRRNGRAVLESARVDGGAELDPGV